MIIPDKGSVKAAGPSNIVPDEGSVVIPRNSTNTSDYIDEYKKAGLENPGLTLRQVFGQDKRDTNTAKRDIHDMRLNQELQDGPLQDASDILFGGLGGAVGAVGAKRGVNELFNAGKRNLFKRGEQGRKNIIQKSGHEYIEGEQILKQKGTPSDIQKRTDKLNSEIREAGKKDEWLDDDYVDEVSRSIDKAETEALSKAAQLALDDVAEPALLSILPTKLKNTLGKYLDSTIGQVYNPAAARQLIREIKRLSEIHGVDGDATIRLIQSRLPKSGSALTAPISKADVATAVGGGVAGATAAKQESATKRLFEK